VGQHPRIDNLVGDSCIAEVPFADLPEGLNLVRLSPLVVEQPRRRRLLLADWEK